MKKSKSRSASKSAKRLKKDKTTTVAMHFDGSSGSTSFSDSPGTMGELTEAVAQSYYPQTSKLLTDPYNACCQWAFGDGWRNLQFPQALLKYEMRHRGGKTFTADLDQQGFMKIITREWAEAVREGRDSDMIVRDAIDKAVEKLNG